MSTTKTPDTPKTATAASWKKAKRHAGITLPSGAVVDIELPNIQLLIKAGAIPNNLLDAALQHQNAKEVTADMIKETWDYTVWILPRTVVSPEITEEDVKDLPAEDVEMLTGFAARTNDIDAVGHHLAGLETQRRFREVRGLLTAEEVVRDL
jgi:hypothetical protein